MGGGRLAMETISPSDTPVQIGSDHTWIKSAAKYGHTAGIKADGSLWTWGLNSKGQLGDGTTNDRNAPSSNPVVIVCNYSLSQTANSDCPSGGCGGNINVIGVSGCPWTATPSQTWITVTGGSGTGSGSFSYSVSANGSTSSRSGTIVVATQTFTITQAPISETISIPNTPTGPSNGARGISYSFSTGGAISNYGHTVQYQFDWGDGTDSGWLPVGTTSASRTWTVAGTYQVKVQARCSTDLSVLSAVSAANQIVITPATIVSGNINSNTTWTCANSPYIMINDITVDSNVTLNISNQLCPDSPIVVKFIPGKSMNVYGTLNVAGNSSNKIYFTSINDNYYWWCDRDGDPDQGDWGTVFFNGNYNVVGDFDHGVVSLRGRRCI